MNCRNAVVTALIALGFLSAPAPSARARSLSPDSPTSPTSRFRQDRFAVGFWVDPPADEKMEQRYREIADANFTLVIGGFGASRGRQIVRQLELCEKFGLKALVGIPQRNLEKLAPESPALWGYLLQDEPSISEFPRLTSAVQEIRSLRPGRLAFINLHPNYAPVHATGTADYSEYVGRFLAEVGPEVLCMDHYPLFRPDHRHDGRASYLDNLAVMRDESLKAGVPFWNFFNTMPYGPHSDPTEAQLRWQIYATIAHGARGVLWFCYYTPEGGEFPKGGAIIGRDDLPTRHYDQARRINAELKALGPTLMQLTSTRVVRALAPGRNGESADTSATLAGGPIRSLSGDPAPNCLIGEFRHADGRRAVLLHNHDFAYTSWPTVEFDAPAESVREVSKTTGAEMPLRDDSPAMPGLQLSLDAGDARLFLLP